MKINSKIYIIPFIVLIISFVSNAFVIELTGRPTYQGSFTVIGDIVPPNITASSPSGTITVGTLNLSVTTDETASCRYIPHTEGNILSNYSDMTYNFTDNIFNHYKTLTLANGYYEFYARCTDNSGNFMNGSENISFTVDIEEIIVTVPGGGGGGSEPIKPPEPKPNFELDEDFIKVSIKPGESERETISITNTGETILAIKLTLGYLRRFIAISEDSFSLDIQDKKTINLDIFAKEDEQPDAYVGRIIVEGGGITKIINIIIEVQAKVPLFDVNLETTKPSVKPDEEVTVDMDITNLGDLKNIDISLYYAIKDLDGNILNYKEETVAIDKELNLLRSLELPKEYSCVDYVFYTRAKYGNVGAAAAQIFSVDCEKTELPAPSKETNWPLLTLILASLIICLVLLIFFMTIEYRKIRIYLKSTLGHKDGEIAVKLKKTEHHGLERAFCKKCRTELKGKKRYCSKCGAKVD